MQKKYKCAKRIIATGQDTNGPALQAKIPYPSSETLGQGDFNLTDFLLEQSEVSKEDYNTFLV